MFHVLSWGIPYALLMTGSPAVFTSNFTDPGPFLREGFEGCSDSNHRCWCELSTRMMDSFKSIRNLYRVFPFRSLFSNKPLNSHATVAKESLSMNVLIWGLGI